MFIAALSSDISEMLALMEEGSERRFDESLDRLNAWLADAAPTPSPLRRPTSSWRVDEGATTSSRTSECLWE